MTKVILVDEQDKVIGTAEKLAAHQQGLLHRAFSVFILRKNPEGKIETLLQQREKDKYHGGSLWTNTCCSHPEPGETIINAGERRLQEELGFSVKLHQIAVFTYRAEFPNGLIEHEVDHVLLGDYVNNLNIMPNPKEVMAIRWMTLDDAEKEYLNDPVSFTPWFQQALKIVKDYFNSLKEY